jgi:hypothetical protein
MKSFQIICIYLATIPCIAFAKDKETPNTKPPTTCAVIAKPKGKQKSPDQDTTATKPGVCSEKPQKPKGKVKANNN